MSKDKIAKLKEKRLETWQSLLPKDVNDLPIEEAQRHAREAENHPDVLELEDQIAALRSKMNESEE